MKDQFPLRERLGRLARRGAGRRQRWDQRLQAAPGRSSCSVNVPFSSVQDHARDRLQQHAVFTGDLFQAPDKDAARLVEHLGFDA